MVHVHKLHKFEQGVSIRQVSLMKHQHACWRSNETLDFKLLRCCFDYNQIRNVT